MKRNIAKIVLFFMSLVILAGCSAEKEKSYASLDFYDNSEYIAVDLIASGALSFDLIFLTAEKVEKVEFVGFSGDGIKGDSFEVSIINNTLDMFADYKYRGLYCSDWLFECKPNENVTECSVKVIELKIDGKMKKIELKNAIEYKVGEGNNIYAEDLQPQVFANDFTSSMINSDESAMYSFVANENLTVKDIKAGAGLDVDVKIYINDDKNQEFRIPLEVKAGTKLNMQITYSSNAQKEISSVLTNLYITYSVGEEEYTRKGVIGFSPIYPVDEELKKIDTYIDGVLGE